MNVPTIHGERVLLREITSDDLAALFEIYSNPEVMRYWSFPPLADLEAAGGLLQKILDDYRQLELLK